MDPTQIWLEHASCADLDRDEIGCFFSEKTQDIAKAKAVCASCPVIGPCLQGALDRSEPCGVWGGQLFSDGMIITAKRNRGRPSKHAKQSDATLPVVEVPAYLRQRAAEVMDTPVALPELDRVAA